MLQLKEAAGRKDVERVAEVVRCICPPPFTAAKFKSDQNWIAVVGGKTANLN